MVTSTAAATEAKNKRAAEKEFILREKEKIIWQSEVWDSFFLNIITVLT